MKNVVKRSYFIRRLQQKRWRDGKTTPERQHDLSFGEYDEIDEVSGDDITEKAQVPVPVTFPWYPPL